MWPPPTSSSTNSSFCFPFPSTLSHRPLFNPPHRPTQFLFPRRFHLSASLSRSDDLNGWAILDSPARPTTTHKGFPSNAVVGVGTSLALLLALFGTFSLSRKGFNVQLTSPLQAMWSSPIETREHRDKVAEELHISDEASPEAVLETVAFAPSTVEKFERVAVPVSVDSTQEEALSVLKTLKIIEDDVEGNELCTRREFARWLVRLNSSLERNLEYRIAPVLSLSGSVVTAFDDVSVEDSDFRYIEVLAEAGVVPSKLSWKNSSNSGGSDSEENISFFPDRFISRLDLIDWRAQLEYKFFFGSIDQISIKKAGYMDVKEITSLAVYVDILAGDRSILRKVFGQSKRLQPNKPATKAQAAVALTSGRMMEAISAELLRIEAENSARQAAAEEIRSELLSRGDIQKFWDLKLSEEKSRGFDAERLYLDAVNNLEEETINQDKIHAEYLKEKEAMDCQKQLLLTLKKEVDEISEKLASERVIYVDEKQIVHKLLKDLEFKHEEMLDTKSTLEAEKEALQILRSWVEDEARRSQARAAVLEEVARRWKWDDQA
ncbi:uncharacterized protein LOC130739603 [Lotus japonicus]|uniref:uncharacterized protein LOC130739603 n=1 Tax=Lotus japonicus TaxID=34305 RepID=UPI00258E1A9D|nr:uncharacterized protein LOC130739603 [Lotus japonicus]